MTTLDAIASTPDSVRLLQREERLALGQRAFSVAWACLASIVDDEQTARAEDGKLLSVREAAPRFGLAVASLYKKWKTDPQIRACSIDNGTDKPAVRSGQGAGVSAAETEESLIGRERAG